MNRLRSVFKHSYRVIRSVLFATALVAVGIIGLLYIALSITPVQNEISKRAEKELSNFLNTKVKIERIGISPFNEVLLNNVTIYTPEGEKCLDIGTLGAGIELWRLVVRGEIVITYAELIDMNAAIWKQTPDSPLNIQFIIDALKPKDPNKPPTKFELAIRNIVIRRCAARFDKRWQPYKSQGVLDYNHLAVSDMRADVALPHLANEDFVIDIRRLAMTERSGLNLKELRLKTHIAHDHISLKNLRVRTNGSELNINDFTIPYESLNCIEDALQAGKHHIAIHNSQINPSDFSALYSPLGDLDFPVTIDLDVTGNLNDIENVDLTLSKNNYLIARISGSARGVSCLESMLLHLKELKINVTSELIGKISEAVPTLQSASKYLIPLGEIRMDIKGDWDGMTGRASAHSYITTDIGDVDLNIRELRAIGKKISANANVRLNSVQIGAFPGLDKLGAIQGDITLSELSIAAKEINGAINANIDYADYLSHRIDNIEIEANKQGNSIAGLIAVADELIDLSAKCDVSIAGAASTYRLDTDINNVVPSAFGILTQYAGYNGHGKVDIYATGNNIENIEGEADIENLEFSTDGKAPIHLEYLTLDSHISDGIRHLKLNSPVARASLTGTPHISREMSASGEITLLPADDLYKFLNLPVRPLSAVELRGDYDGARMYGNIVLSAPYIVQGDHKLIKQTNIEATLRRDRGLNLDANTTIQGKKNDLNLHIAASGMDQRLKAAIDWINGTDNGNVNLAVNSQDGLMTGKNYNIDIDRSNIKIKGENWEIQPAHITYDGRNVNVGKIMIGNGLQYIEINGVAGPSPMDMLTVDLAGINLDYIFDAVNINYVTFGGTATGRAVASGLLGKNISARTERLHVDNFSYNGAIVGPGELEGYWEPDHNKIGINADIFNPDGTGTAVRGGVWLKPDSINFDFYPNKVNLELVQPFLSTFASKIEGAGSGHLRLFGPTTDVDLEGRVLIDTLAMKIGFTNVTYHGRDSLFFTPGRIEVPRLKVTDDYGGTAYFGGNVRHRYFREADIDFTISDARKLLCLDLTPSESPIWYGKVFANGGGKLTGRPGVTVFDVNVTTTANSNFTFVLDDSQTAVDYPFLTFTDTKKKLEETTEEDPEGQIEDYYRTLSQNKKVRPNTDEEESIFILDLGVTVTPDATINLVMDPNAGDKIRGNGRGAMRLHYTSESDEIGLYGKYEIEQGNYNFSLQDLILRDFRIEPGSSIAFNGDPLAGILNITASYRVNTNLTDLDKSFSTDPDLNRTSVPVDAQLLVSGGINQPDIAFNVALPTMTPEVERKVRSIISSEEEMQRQVIYLLALSRFYTPDYMGGAQGGELASVASSTLSSQLSSLVGQLTDKVWLSPSFKADRSDFSDMEIDLALSSRLLDNRLIINGNLGYRDRSTSQTTFIGDFDIEYLLNKRGNFRLKAYNHFNDANYYLRSALTTQGLGVIYKTDFDNLFTKRRKKSDEDGLENRRKEDNRDKESAISD